jgi:hypothetical protein
MITITREERTRLRALAQRVAELSATEENEATRREWYRHNALKAGRPMILVYPEGSWEELLPASLLQCADETAREVEYKLLAQIFQADYLRDDSVVEPEFLVPGLIDYASFVPQQGVHRTTTFCFHTGLVSPVTGWELNPVSGFIPTLWEANRQLGEQQADHGQEILRDTSELTGYTTPRVTYCEKETLEKYHAIGDAIGDILNVRLAGVMHCSFHLASVYCTLRGGMMNLFYDLAERPDLVHRTMARLQEFNLDMIKQYEQQNLFTLNNGGCLQSTGGLGFTSELPAAGFDGYHVRPADIWASCEAQEFSHVSPEMFSEFMMPYEKALMTPFGLTGYGCCEPLENKLDDLFAVQNLRRISCSPFADIKKFAEKVQDRYILSWKPDPAILSNDFETAALETYLREALRKARGTRMEIILKDTHTCQNQPERFRRWIDTARRIVSEEG